MAVLLRQKEKRRIGVKWWVSQIVRTLSTFIFVNILVCRRILQNLSGIK